MWIALAICVAVMVAVAVLPLGVELSSVAGYRKWYLILAGLHIPVPKSVIRRVERRSVGKRGTEVKTKSPTVLDLAGRLRRIQSKESSFADEFDLNDLRAILELAIRLLRTLRIRVHRLHVVIATPDPAMTGVAYGMACALIGALPSDWPISVDADWNSSVSVFTYRVEASVIPCRVLFVVTIAAWKKFVLKK